MASSLERFSHSVIIAPKSLQDEYLLLRRKEPSLDFKLYTLEEVEALFAYRYDDRAILALLKKGHSYEESIDILETLRFLKGSKAYASAKLENLKPLQKELIEAGLLYKDVAPERSFEGKNVLIRGYRDGLRISATLGELHNMSISYDIEEEEAEKKTVYVYQDIYEELHDVYNLIAEDLAQGTPIESIYLLGAGPSYDLWIHEFNKLYGFSIEEAVRERLFDTSLYHEFQALFLSFGIETALERLSRRHPLEGDFAEIYKFGKRFSGVFEDPRAQLDLYDGIAKSKTRTGPSLTKTVRRMNDYFAPRGSHVYLVGFAMGLFPANALENAYYYDEGALELSRPSSEEKTSENAAELSSLLHSKELVFLSYHEKESGQYFFPSGACQKESLPIRIPTPLPYEYSKSGGAYLLSSLLDLKKNFLFVDPRLESLQKSVSLPFYRSYDFRYTPFKPIDSTKKRSYSPTSLKLYYGCPFSYYLQRVLCLSDEETDASFRVRIGKMMHKVMEELYKDPSFDFEGSWEKAFEEESATLPFSDKEEALLQRIKDECHAAVAFCQSHDAILKKPVFKSEFSFELPLPSNPLVSLRGQYDKSVSFGEKERYFALIDYKTGSERFDEDLLPYGLSLQLPIYAYYALGAEEFKKEELIGLFIAPLLSSPLLKKPKETLEKFNSDKFKLEGVFTNDIDKLREMDPEAERSSLIRGLGYSSKNGRFLNYSLPKLKSKQDFFSFASEAEKQTLSADEKICSGDFAIAPLSYLKANYDACSHCSFRDVCYRDESAVVRLPPNEGQKEEDEDQDDETEGEEEDNG